MQRHTFDAQRTLRHIAKVRLLRSLEDGPERAGMRMPFTEMDPPVGDVFEQTLGEIEGH